MPLRFEFICDSGAQALLAILLYHPTEIQTPEGPMVTFTEDFYFVLQVLIGPHMVKKKKVQPLLFWEES